MRFRSALIVALLVSGPASLPAGAEGKQALLAFEEDGRSLAADGPRLVMPGDVKGGRYVTGVSSVTVTALPAPPAFGDARYLGRDPSTRTDAIRLVISVTGSGYRIVHSDATVTSIGSLPAAVQGLGQRGGGRRHELMALPEGLHRVDDHLGRFH